MCFFLKRNIIELSINNKNKTFYEFCMRIYVFYAISSLAIYLKKKILFT